jgi:hypothetical protein
MSGGKSGGSLSHCDTQMLSKRIESRNYVDGLASPLSDSVLVVVTSRVTQGQNFCIAPIYNGSDTTAIGPVLTTVNKNLKASGVAAKTIHNYFESDQ